MASGRRKGGLRRLGSAAKRGKPPKPRLREGAAHDARSIKSSRARKRTAKLAETKKPTLRIDAAPIIARLPQLGPAETMQVWSNALRRLHEAKDEEERRQAQAVLDGVETVWMVRARGAPEGWFKWPSTDAPTGKGKLPPEEWLDEGPLKFLGYTVGRNGEAPGTRRAVLKRAFEGVLPPVFPPDYLRQWGEPGSAQRLHKMADSIASFVRSAKRRDEELLSEAIADWEADLRYLYETYYVSRFGFAWPQIK